jgi:hypothetical protein
MAGIAMEEILQGTIAHAPIAEDSQHDEDNARADLEYAYKYVEIVGRPHIVFPNVDFYVRRAKELAKNILSWESSQRAVETLADELVAQMAIEDSERIKEIIEHEGLRFGAAFPAFVAGIDVR